MKRYFINGKFSNMGVWTVPSKEKSLVGSRKYDFIMPRVFVQVEALPFIDIKPEINVTLPISLWKNIFKKNKVDVLDNVVNINTGVDKMVWSPRFEKDSVFFITRDKKKTFFNLIYSQPTYFKKLYAENAKIGIRAFVGSNKYRFMMDFCVRCSLKLISLIAPYFMFNIEGVEDVNSMKYRYFQKPTLAQPIHCIMVNYAKVLKNGDVVGYNNCTEAKDGMMVQIRGTDVYELDSKLNEGNLKVVQIFDTFPPRFRDSKIEGTWKIIDFGKDEGETPKISIRSKSHLIRYILPPVNI